jgi:hypothetical protein
VTQIDRRHTSPERTILKNLVECLLDMEACHGDVPASGLGIQREQGVTIHRLEGLEQRYQDLMRLAVPYVGVRT